MAYNVLNKQDFEQELEEAGNKLVIIDFYANWCGPCKIIDPQLNDLSLQYTGKAKFLKVNVDDCEEIAIDYTITSGNVEKLAKNIEKYVEEGLETAKKLTIAVQEEDAGLDYHDYAGMDLEDLPEDPTSILEVIVDDQM